MKIELSNKTIVQQNADYEIIFIINKNLEHKFIQDSKDFVFYNYKGDGILNLAHKQRIYVGISNLSANALRIGIFKALKAIATFDIKSVKIANYAKDECDLLALAQGAILSTYDFDKYKSEKNIFNIKNLFICATNYDETINIKFDDNLINEAEILADSINFARNISNEIPAIYTPAKMADDAMEYCAKNTSVKCEILDKNDMKKENMNALLAVGNASANEAKLVHLSYKPKNAKLKVAFVGKGVTYDTGGLSLKPSDYMLSMKVDKSGAAAAFAIIKAASQSKMDIEIHSILGCVENAIGSKAYKPDDVLIAKNGVSIEVRNTDAEGRLVLADALVWTQEKIKPDLIIDIATLTGASSVGLGEYTSAILGNNYELQSQFYKAVKHSGELFTILEFNEFLSELIKSQVADVSNAASSRYGGAITAGLFLDKFINKEYKDKWLHLDIAGPAFANKAWGVNPAGATGAGVSACYYFLKELSKKAKK